MKQKDLAICLSHLEMRKNSSASLEQYQTECNIAASFLWSLYMRKEIQDVVVADLGCGNGVLGIGALFLGAKKVFFVDVDQKALELTKKNIESLENDLNCSFAFTCVCCDISQFSEKVDLVLQNPPFGVQQEHADRPFLQKAFALSSLIYSFHKIESGLFLETFAKEHGFSAEIHQTFDFPLQKTMAYHKKEVYLVPVGIWRFRKL